MLLTPSESIDVGLEAAYDLPPEGYVKVYWYQGYSWLTQDNWSEIVRWRVKMLQAVLRNGCLIGRIIGEDPLVC